MVLIFVGPSCAGKSSAAEKVKEKMGAEIYSGKDYLRLAKNEGEAWKLFCGKIENASGKEKEESLIFVCTERDLYERLKGQPGLFTIGFSADPGVIKRRFAERMRGNLPKPLEMMLEKQIAAWESVEADLLLDSTRESSEELAGKILDFIS